MHQVHISYLCASWIDQIYKKAEKPTKKTVTNIDQRIEMKSMSSYKTSRAREMLAMQPMKTTSNKKVKTTSEAVRLNGCQQMKNFGNMRTGKRKKMGDDPQEDSRSTKRTRDTSSLLQEDTASSGGVVMKNSA